MELKKFQSAALEELKKYLDHVKSTGDPEQAFIQLSRLREPDKTPPPYRIIPDLPDVPNVCLRLPTGAGKTLLASHTIGEVARSFLERDYPVVLWLVPTNTIRKQTAEALKKSSHPYRAAIDEAFEGRVAVFDISEVAQIRPQDLTERVCVVLSTIQSLRTTNTEGRRAYAHSENFEPHFSRIPANSPGLELDEEGRVKFSFVNLMAFHRPLVLVDEAHKAGTALSFDMLAALRPACIVEFTATPNTDSITGSNVIFRVSAAEVRAEQMIKLPIILTEHPDWRAAVHDAIETRARLAETANQDSRYIRPLTLFQAQDRGQEVTVEVLKKHLIENENIPCEAIAIATGEQRELDSVNLFDHTCPVEFIITVEALKEGWDCSFAYVLCSVANIGSATDIEQLLGRVLRMPYAESRVNAALNQAYAHVSSPRFGEAASALRDTLVEKMGFEPDEAATSILLRQLETPVVTGQAQLTPILIETLETVPDLTGLEEEVVSRIKIETLAEGNVRVAVKGEIPEALETRLIEAASTPERREKLRLAVEHHRLRVLKSISPAMRGEKLDVPNLYLLVQGELQLVDEQLLEELGEWSLTSYAADLTPEQFTIRETAETWEVDLKGEKVVYTHLDQRVQTEIGILKVTWTELQLSRWLDKECRQPDITQPVLLEFCRKIIVFLTETRNIPLEQLLRFKYQLAKAVREKIARYRQQVRARGYQTFLLRSKAQAQTRSHDGFAFERDRPYLPSQIYRGAYRFKKHFFAEIGDLNTSGEEFECARTVDTLPEVKYWVRNLVGRDKHAFWLPTSTDRFYPDFVAQLEDGRTLVVEYKGSHLIDSQDTKEKRNIGELWAAKSQGKGIFVMAEKVDSQGRDTRAQIQAAIQPRPIAAR